MNKYCRYCTHCIAQSDDRAVCAARKYEIVASTAIRNNCEHFEFCEIDAFDSNRIYKSRNKSKGSRGKDIEGQISFL